MLAGDPASGRTGRSGCSARRGRGRGRTPGSRTAWSWPRRSPPRRRSPSGRTAPSARSPARCSPPGRCSPGSCTPRRPRARRPGRPGRRPRAYKRGGQFRGSAGRGRRRPWGWSGPSSRGCPGPRARGCRRGRSPRPALSPDSSRIGQHDVARRARVGGALQDDELARPQSRAAIAAGGADDVGQVRLAGLGQRRRHADEDGVRLGEAVELGGRLEAGGGASQPPLPRTCARCSSRRVRAGRPCRGRCRTRGRGSRGRRTPGRAAGRRSRVRRSPRTPASRGLTSGAA